MSGPCGNGRARARQLREIASERVAQTLHSSCGMKRWLAPCALVLAASPALAEPADPAEAPASRATMFPRVEVGLRGGVSLNDQAGELEPYGELEVGARVKPWLTLAGFASATRYSDTVEPVPLGAPAQLDGRQYVVGARARVVFHGLMGGLGVGLDDRHETVDHGGGQTRAIHPFIELHAGYELMIGSHAIDVILARSMAHTTEFGHGNSTRLSIGVVF